MQNLLRFKILMSIFLKIRDICQEMCKLQFLVIEDLIDLIIAQF